jgi:hypothetical protein
MRKSHLVVEQVKAPDQRETLKTLVLAELALKSAVRSLSRDNPALKNARGSLRTQLQLVRHNRKIIFREGFRFRAHHRKHPDSVVEYISTNRTFALQNIREVVREVRRHRQRSIHRERLNADRMPYRGVHQIAGLYLLAQKMRRADSVFREKRPTSLDNYVGIELEFICPSGREVLAVDLVEAELGNYTHLHGDGSVSQDQKRPGEELELSILLKQSEVAEVIPRIAAVLARRDCYVNRTCGMHVHLDMRNRDQQRAFQQLVRAQPTLYAMVPPGRKASKFCSPTRGAKLQHKHIHGERYKGINAAALRKHTTIEVRIHSGTLLAHKICRWVELLTAIVDGPELKGTPRTPTALCRRLHLPEELRVYILQRVAQFAAAQPETPPTQAIDEMLMAA